MQKQVTQNLSLSHHSHPVHTLYDIKIH